jgi:hypothetical protein
MALKLADKFPKPRAGGNPATQFKPGIAPGRPVGFENAGRKYNNIGKALEELGFDWLAEAVNRFHDPRTPNASKDFCLGLITDRVAPKLKSIEVSGKNGSDLNKIVMNIVSGSVIPAGVIPVIEGTVDRTWDHLLLENEVSIADEVNEDH